MNIIARVWNIAALAGILALMYGILQISADTPLAFVIVAILLAPIALKLVGGMFGILINGRMKTPNGRWM